MRRLTRRFLSAGGDSLTLERTITLPGVEGWIDHFASDPASNHLFVAALGNNLVEVLCLTKKRLYVGHGSGALGEIGVTNNGIVANIPLKAHPKSFQLEKNGTRVFVNVPGAHHIAVIDRQKKSVLPTWSLRVAAGNFAMALDESNHRLMIGCRLPAQAENQRQYDVKAAHRKKPYYLKRG